MLMTTAPRPSSENRESASGDSASDLLARVLHYERPSVAANDPGSTNVIDLARRNETLNGARVEQTGLWGSMTGLFMARTETRAALNVHDRAIANDAAVVTENVQDLADTWNDDRRLKRRLDQYERYNRKYGDVARHLAEAEIQPDATPDAANDNEGPKTPEEQAAAEEENRLKAESIARWKRFAVQREGETRWRSKKLFKSAFGWENIKDHWKNKKNIWSFFKSLGADYAQWKAVKSAVPSVNVITYGAKRAAPIIEKTRETAETVGDGVALIGDAKRTQRLARREGAETVVLTSEVGRSNFIRTQILRLVRGEISREQVMRTVRLAFLRFKRQDPDAFAKMIRGYGLTARSINNKAGFYELFKNAALWYTPWRANDGRSFWEQNETAIPIWGSYAAWRDIGVDNGLPLWTRLTFATVGTALDVGTVLSFGALSPVLAAGKAAMFKGGTVIARKAAKEAAEAAAAQGVRRSATAQLGSLLGRMPRAARNALSVKGAKSVVFGAAAYTGLSMGIDYLFDIEDRVFALATAGAQTALNQEFSRQQRRLIKMVGRDVGEVVEDAYADYREERRADEPDPEKTESPEAANDDRAPELTAGQIADVTERKEA